MPSTIPSTSTITQIARVPYLNSVPFFQGWSLGERYQFIDCVPRELGLKAAAGEVVAGLLPIMDLFRLEDSFERFGRVGIAVRGRARSALLFSRKPIRQLDGSTIAITHESSTTAVLLRLLLEQRYEVVPAAYQRGAHPEADALLLIGDEALQFKQANTRYPFEIDVGFEWWLWQHLPFVFAVWAIRKDVNPHEKKRIEASLMHSLAVNLGQLESIAQTSASTMGLPSAEIHEYLTNFAYRLGPAEEEAIQKFRALVHEHRLF